MQARGCKLQDLGWKDPGLCWRLGKVQGSLDGLQDRATGSGLEGIGLPGLDLGFRVADLTTLPRGLQGWGVAVSWAKLHALRAELQCFRGGDRNLSQPLPTSPNLSAPLRTSVALWGPMGGVEAL